MVIFNELDSQKKKLVHIFSIISWKWPVKKPTVWTFLGGVLAMIPSDYIYQDIYYVVNVINIIVVLI